MPSRCGAAIAKFASTRTKRWWKISASTRRWVMKKLDAAPRPATIAYSCASGLKVECLEWAPSELSQHLMGGFDGTFANDRSNGSTNGSGSHYSTVRGSSTAKVRCCVG